MIPLSLPELQNAFEQRGFRVSEVKNNGFSADRGDLFVLVHKTREKTPLIECDMAGIVDSIFVNHYPLTCEADIDILLEKVKCAYEAELKEKAEWLANAFPQEKKGLAAIIGKWLGNETDAEVEEGLAALRGDDMSKEPTHAPDMSELSPLSDTCKETLESADKLYRDLAGTLGIACMERIHISEIRERTHNAYAMCARQWGKGLNQPCQCDNCHRTTMLTLLQNIYWAVRVLEPPIDTMGEKKARLYLAQGRAILDVIKSAGDSLDTIAMTGIRTLTDEDGESDGV